MITVSWSLWKSDLVVKKQLPSNLNTTNSKSYSFTWDIYKQLDKWFAYISGNQFYLIEVDMEIHFEIRISLWS